MKHITPVLKNYIGSKFKIESYTKLLCLHRNRITILHRLIYVNGLIIKKSYVNTHLGTDHHHLIMPPISKNCSNTFLEHAFIYAAPCEWNKLYEHIRILIVSGRVLKQCYLHNNMDADCKYKYYCYLCCDYC